MLSVITAVGCGVSRDVERSMIFGEIAWNTIRYVKKNIKNRLVKKK